MTQKHIAKKRKQSKPMFAARRENADRCSPRALSNLTIKKQEQEKRERNTGFGFWLFFFVSHNEALNESKKLQPDLVEIDLGRVRAGAEQAICLTSDRHYDSVHCLRDLEQRHLEAARRRGAIIIDLGDLCDAMQSRSDPRASYDLLANAHKRAAYLDSLVEGAVERYGPYASHWAVAASGNHESVVLHKYGTDLTGRIAAGLGKHVAATRVNRALRLLLYYNHGSSNGGMMSFGTLDTRRIGSYIAGANVIAQGHTHDCYVLPTARESIDSKGKPRRELVWHVRCPSYLDDFSGRGWTARTGKPPRVHGCIWCVLQFEPHEINLQFAIDVE